MGERSAPAPQPAFVEAPPHAARWTLIAALLVLALLAVVTEPPRDADAVATVEQATAFARGPAAPFVYTLFLAPFVALGGVRIALLAQVLLLAGGVLLSERVLVRQLGRQAAWLPLLLLVGSVAWVHALRPAPGAMLLALVLLAFALAAGAAPPPPRRDAMPDLYPEDTPERPSSLGRWLGVGALLGTVVTAAPWTVPLLWPAAVAAPPGRRGRAAWGIAIGGVLAIVVVWLLAAWRLGAAGENSSFGTSLATTAQRSLAELLAPVAGGSAAGRDSDAIGGAQVDPLAWGWSLAYALVGRHIGALFYLSPLLVLAALASGGTGRWQRFAAAALGLVLLVLLRPFDLAAATATVGLGTVLPLYGALWLVPSRAPGKGALTFGWLLAAAVLWPLWTAPRMPLEAWEGSEEVPFAPGSFAVAGEPLYLPPYLRPWAPLESTQPRLRYGARLAFADGRALLYGGSTRRGSVAAVPTATWVELLVAVPGKLDGFWVDAGEQSGNELPVRGAEVTETVFRPDGGISFLVRPKRPQARHAMPGGGEPWSFYHLAIRLPGPVGKSFTVRLRPG